jgi:hypothetical protein
LNQNLNIITNGIGGVSDAVTTTAGLHTSSFSTQPTPSASTAYLLGGVFSDNLAGYYDSSSEDLMYSDSSNSYSSPSNPTDATKSWFSSGKSFTIYATYTAGGGAGPANIKTYNGIASASVKTINGVAIASVKTWNGIT